MEELSPLIEDELRALEGGWVTTPCRCALCGFSWAAVWPIDLDVYDINDEEELSRAVIEGIPNLQCSKCGQQGSTFEIEWDEIES